MRSSFFDPPLEDYSGYMLVNGLIVSKYEGEQTL